MRTGVAGLASLSSSTSSICISFREEPGSPGFCVEGGMPRSYARRVLPSSLSMMYPSFYAYRYRSQVQVQVQAQVQAQVQVSQDAT